MQNIVGPLLFVRQLLRQLDRCSRRDSNSYVRVVVLLALFSVAAPGATLPPPSLESLLPTSDRQATGR
jgi:hypothetical protein